MAPHSDATLSGRAALVTGAGKGIGRSIALALARDGARVVAVGRRKELVEATVQQVRERRGTASALAADVTADDFLERLAQVERTIDVVVHNAAAFAPYGML